MNSSPWRAVLPAIATLLLTVQAFSDPTPKPFHVFFDRYEQNAADGSYTFVVLFLDLPLPHILQPGDRQPKKFKIGDTFGHYKITAFKVVLVPHVGPLVDGPSPLDESRLTFQNINDPKQTVQVPFRQEINFPDLGVYP